MELSAGLSAGTTMPNHAHRSRHTVTARCVDGQKSRLVKNSNMLTGSSPMAQRTVGRKRGQAREDLLGMVCDN